MKSDFVLFLISSVFPLYCAGYAGLIHIARTDPDLYQVIATRAGRLIVPVLCGVSACAAFFVLADWRNENRDWTLLVMTGLPLLFIWHAWGSSSFFEAISSIPRIQKAPDDRSGKNTEDNKDQDEPLPEMGASTPVPEKTLIRFSVAISAHGDPQLLANGVTVDEN